MTDDIDEVVTFETLEEAIAQAMEDVGEDGIVLVHAEDCELDEKADTACACEPLTLERGAKA